MRFTRLFVALVAIFSVGLTGLMTSAHAAEGTADRAKPRHVISYLQSGETARDGVFYTKGRLTKAKGHAVYLQVRTAKKPKWRTVTGERSARSNGKFGFTFRGKCGAAYRLVIKESPSYRRTEQRVGKVRCY